MAAKMILLSKVKDNPWRDKKRNPINEEQVERLKESIETTEEFWEGVYGREVAGGFVELAFGHHRLDAARAAGLMEIPITLRKLSDGDMLMRMARENMRGELPVMLEAVAATVRAFGEGKIELEAVAANMRKENLRYAPSFIAGAIPPGGNAHPYTAATIARFLGSVYYKPSTKQAQNSVVAALSILETEEMKIEGFKLETLRKEERTLPRTEGVMYNPQEKEEMKYKSVKEIINILSNVKQNYKVIQERRGKSAEEIANLNAQRLEAQAKAKAAEKQADDERKALIKAEADARREENNAKADKLAAERREKDSRAKEKEALNKLRMAEFETQLEAKKAWEASQRVQDAYLPIRRDVEAMLGRMETVVSERNPFREQVKSLATHKGITANDKQRLRVAAVAVADWYGDWVAPQFAPELKAAQKRAVDTRKAAQPRPKGKGGA